MDRFSHKHTGRFPLKGLLIPLCSFIAAMAALLYGLSSISDVAASEQKKSLEAALGRSIMDCYATEGAYPESLDYIEEHYALYYDKDRFYISYQPIGSNIMPAVTIIDKNP